MTSKQNLNVKNTFKFKFQILNLIKMLQTWFLKISLHPYYSSRIGWNILLYESLWFTILTSHRRNGHALAEEARSELQDWGGAWEDQSYRWEWYNRCKRVSHIQCFPRLAVLLWEVPPEWWIGSLLHAYAKAIVCFIRGRCLPRARQTRASRSSQRL